MVLIYTRAWCGEVEQIPFTEALQVYHVTVDSFLCFWMMVIGMLFTHDALSPYYPTSRKEYK